MAAAIDRRGTQAPASMSRYQYLVVALCCATNVADGFDVVSLSVAAPVLSKDWHVDPAVLGTLFSAAAVGLTIGAFLVAPLADKVGRRPIMLGALGSLAVSLLLTAISATIWQLLVLRFATGIGLGTLVVCLNVTAAEYSSDKMRNLCMSLVHMGFTVGMMIGSGIAAAVLATSGWRLIFVFAGLLNVLTFIFGVFLIGESQAFLTRRRGPGDLARLNRLRRRMLLPEFEVMPPPPEAALRRGAAIGMMLEPAIRWQTILIWAASLTYAIVGYFLLNWKPTILANAGLSPALAAASGIITGFCGALGHLAMGLLARRVGEGRLTAIFFGLAAVTLVIFGVQPPDPVPLLAMAGLTTFFVVGAYTGLFLVAVVMYPPAIQNSGVGFVVGFGRIGAIIGPMIGGFLLSAGLTRMDTYFVFSVIALIPFVTMHLANRLAAQSRRATSQGPSGDYDAESARQAV